MSRTRRAKPKEKYRNTCYIGKVKLNRVAADKRAKVMTGPEQRYMSYRCSVCRGWHVGRWLPPQTLAKIRALGMRPPKVYESGDDWRPLETRNWEI